LVLDNKFDDDIVSKVWEFRGGYVLGLLWLL